MELNIGSVLLPLVSLFDAERQTLEQWCLAQRDSWYRDRVKSIASRRDACAYLIEGLYQAWCCLRPKTALEIPLHAASYHVSRVGAINHLSHQFVLTAVSGLEALGWARVKRGYRTAEGKNVITNILPAGALLRRFEETGMQWQELVQTEPKIILRDKDPHTQRVTQEALPSSTQVRQMLRNLRAINAYLAKQAICLHMSNEHLRELGQESSGIEFPLIFTHVALRRIFSRGSLTKGGRFYGAWWEGVPSKYRPYLTINGLACGEIDFRELHPRLLYMLNKQPVPEGDLYDDGWRDPSTPEYSARTEPYLSRRKLFKTVFNATLNDEHGQFRLCKVDYQTAKRFGLNLPKIRQILFRKHPLLMTVHRSGIGLELQFVDSQIAEQVMLALMRKDIPCLPIHDSFLVPRHQVRELISTMQEAFEAVTGHSPALKDVEPFATDFRLSFTPSGEVDLPALHAMHDDALHNRFVQGRWAAEQRRGKGSQSTHNVKKFFAK